jgi:ribosomal protein S18 acetylase RimI-like enzyme
MNNIVSINDVSIITEVVNNSFITVAKEFCFTKENAPTFPAFIGEDRIESDLNRGLIMYGYSFKNKIIGCVGYSIRNGNYLIERLAVLPEFRHKNIGKKLMKYAEQKIIENNGTLIEINIVNENKKLKDWYRGIGYKEIEIKEYEDLPFKVGILMKEINIKNNGVRHNGI